MTQMPREYNSTEYPLPGSPWNLSESQPFPVCLCDCLEGHLRQCLLAYVMGTVGQGMFHLCKICPEIREYLARDLSLSCWCGGFGVVCEDFADPKLYPMCALQAIPRLAATLANPFPAIPPNASTSPIALFYGYGRSTLGRSSWDVWDGGPIALLPVLYYSLSAGLWVEILWISGS